MPAKSALFIFGVCVAVIAARPAAGATQLQVTRVLDSPTRTARLAVIDGTRYVSTEDGLLSIDNDGQITPIGLTHPTGSIRSVSRAMKADDGLVYAAASFATAGILSPWDSALYRVDTPGMPVATYERRQVDFIAVDRARRAYGTVNGFDFVFDADGSPGVSTSSRLDRVEDVTTSGVRIINENGQRSGLQLPDGSFLSTDPALGRAVDARDAADGSGLNIASRQDVENTSITYGDSRTHRINRFTPRTGDYQPIDGVLATESELVISWVEHLSDVGQDGVPGRIKRHYSLHAPASYLTDLVLATDGDTIPPTVRLNDDLQIGSLPLHAFLRSLVEPQSDHGFDVFGVESGFLGTVPWTTSEIIDLSTQDGVLHLLVASDSGVWLVSAGNPAAVPEPNSVLLLATVVALASTLRR